MYVRGRRYIHTCVWGWCEVCLLVEEHTYIPLFGGGCEVCMLGEEDTYIPAFGAGVRYVC